MDARFYNSEEIDIERLANDIVHVYQAQGYQAQSIGNRDQMLIQLKKGGDLEAIIGLQAALSLTIQRTTGGILAMIGQQKWLDKAAVGAVGIVALPVLWPLALTAGVGALRQASLSNQVLNVVDGLIRQQRPGVQIGPIPVQLMPQLQRQLAPPSQVPAYVPSQPPALPLPPPTFTPQTLHCTNCNTPYESGDTFCSGCGRSLTPPRLYCSNCNSEIKPGVSFCPKCGASTFHSLAANHPAPPPPKYIPSAPQTPVYTPPAPQTPVYTPPAPQTPVYTPTQQTPVYTPPTQQTPVYTPTSASEPTVAAQPAPQQPTEPYYVPPVTQTPSVVPQPKVTIVPSTEKQEPPAQPKPQRPQTTYYTPPAQSQPTIPAQKPLAPPPVPPKPLQAHAVAKPLQSADIPWGTLTFSSGEQISLRGERVLVGRYDHDLGGIHPEVDLGKMQGSDTVSRIHAAIEHIGSTYTITDLNSTNATRINNKRLEPDKATPVNHGDAILFGKVSCTFNKE